MAVVEELIRAEADKSLSFGNYKLQEKAKKDGFELRGDLYKVKTFNEITKLERNGMFVYESVPGTAVNGFVAEDWGVEFMVECDRDAQITVQLEEESSYTITVNGVPSGTMDTGMSGKVAVSVELSEDMPALIRMEKVF